MFNNLILDLFILLILLICVKFKIENDYYKCSKCHHKFKPKYKDAFHIVFHLNHKSSWSGIVKCPKCGRRFI